jgi:hypothetical protein
MYQAVNENFESKDFWLPGSQIGRLEKVTALVEADWLSTRSLCGVAHNLGFNSGRQMATARVAIRLPCFQ